MASLAELGEITKSQVGIAGKFVSATKMTGKQRNQLRSHLIAQRAARQHKGQQPFMRSKLTTKQREFGDQFNRGAAVMASRPKGVHGASEGWMNPEGTPKQVEAVSREAKRQGIKKPISVARNLFGGRGGGTQAVAFNTGGRGRGGVVVISGENANPALLTHEMAHLSPKRRTGMRMHRIMAHPQKAAREEARADAVMFRRHGKVPIAEGTSPGTAYEHNAIAVERADAVGRRVAARGVPKALRNAGTKGLAASINAQRGSPVVFNPRQARAYADVRRSTGTWKTPSEHKKAPLIRRSPVADVLAGQRKASAKGVAERFKRRIRGSSE